MKRAHRKQKQVRTVSAKSSPELSRTLVRWTVVRVLDGRVVRHSGDRLEAAEIALKVQVQKLIKQKVRIVRTDSDYPYDAHPLALSIPLTPPSLFCQRNVLARSMTVTRLEPRCQCPSDAQDDGVSMHAQPCVVTLAIHFEAFASLWARRQRTRSPASAVDRVRGSAEHRG
jgi:hypothetical protein